MRTELTAVVEQVLGSFRAYCAEIPEANGRGATKEAAVSALQKEVTRIFDLRRETAIAGAAANATFETFTVQ